VVRRQVQLTEPLAVFHLVEAAFCQGLMQTALGDGPGRLLVNFREKDQEEGDEKEQRDWHHLAH